MSQYIVKSAVSDKSQAMFFPAREKELQSYCDNLGIVNDMKSKVVVLEIMPDRRLTGLLTEREYNLSELNLFATVYDALNKYEKDIFFAVVEAKKYDTLFDFINLCCNTDCYGLVDDFSDLDAIGKKIYLNEVGMNPEQELARFNGEAFIMGIMEHNPPLITSHGIIYQNNNFEKKVYNGKCFPSLDTNKPITLCLNTKLDRDFLYLPCEQSEVDKAFERLNVDSFSDVSLEVDDYDLPKNIADIVLADLTDFEKLNSIAKTLDEVGKHEHGHLSQLVEFTKITEVEELEVLSRCMFEFEVLPDIYDDYQYGYHIIAESGRFDYDETLKAIADHVDEEDRDGVPIQDSIGRMQQTPIINESGLYSLILSSKLPSAKAFKSWITRVVIPSIRKYGGYITYEKMQQMFADPTSLSEFLRQMLKLTDENTALKSHLCELAPKAEYFDKIVESNLLVNFRNVANELKIRQKDFINFLEENGYIYRTTKSVIMPYRKHIRDGLFELVEYCRNGHAGVQTLITPHGRHHFLQIYLNGEMEVFFI